MKISRRRKHNKRSKYTKRVKYTRHTKRGGGKHYKNKRTYRKHPRKLKHKSRLQRGGVKIKINDFMKISTDLGVIQYFFEDEDDKYTVSDSSDNPKRQPLELTYTKDRRGDTFIPPFFKSKTKEFPNKRFDWRITLLSIREIPDKIHEVRLFTYRYSFKIQLCCMLKDGRYITFNIYAYADSKNNYLTFNNTLHETWICNSIHVQNEDDVSEGYKSLDTGLVLKGNISEHCYDDDGVSMSDDLDVSMIDDNTRIYTFPYIQNSGTFQQIADILYTLKKKADEHVQFYLGMSYPMRLDHSYPGHIERLKRLESLKDLSANSPQEKPRFLSRQ
jgi:hypothetical protein